MDYWIVDVLLMDCWIIGVVVLFLMIVNANSLKKYHASKGSTKV